MKNCDPFWKGLRKVFLYPLRRGVVFRGWSFLLLIFYFLLYPAIGAIFVGGFWGIIGGLIIGLLLIHWVTYFFAILISVGKGREYLLAPREIAESLVFGLIFLLVLIVCLLPWGILKVISTFITPVKEIEWVGLVISLVLLPMGYIVVAVEESTCCLFLTKIIKAIRVTYKHYFPLLGIIYGLIFGITRGALFLFSLINYIPGTAFSFLLLFLFLLFLYIIYLIPCLLGYFVFFHREELVKVLEEYSGGI